MNKKKELGQFFTTNASYILQGFEQFVDDKSVSDPFAGNGDLLQWASKNNAKELYGYDIDSRSYNYNDSLLSIPTHPFYITNPPFLAKNKMERETKEKYKANDLYLLAVSKIIEANPEEGILILPINFFSAQNSINIRTNFLDHYEVPNVNYFQDQAFADASLNIVSFYYKRHKKVPKFQDINFCFYPDKTTISIRLEQQYKYQIAGREIEEYKKRRHFPINRLSENFLLSNPGDFEWTSFLVDKKTQRKFCISPSAEVYIRNNIILLNAVDAANQIYAQDIRETGFTHLVGKKSSRHLAHILIPQFMNIDQIEIIKQFNIELNMMRKKYGSLFLSNFMDRNRKRISFNLAYDIIYYVYDIMKESRVPYEYHRTY